MGKNLNRKNIFCLPIAYKIVHASRESSYVKILWSSDRTVANRHKKAIVR